MNKEILIRRRWIWWISPFGHLLFIVFPIYLFTGVSFNQLGSASYLFGLVIVAIFTISCFPGITRHQRNSIRQPIYASLGINYQKRANQTLLALFVLTAAGYTIWFADLIFNPGLIKSLIVENQAFTVRGTISTTPGLSSFAQMGVAYSIVYSINRFALKSQTTKRQQWLLYVIIFLAFSRSILWSERLALIELIAPIGVIYFLFGTRAKSTKIALIPVYASLGLYALFSTMEYFRSWQYYSQQRDDFFRFTLDRLLSYYTTSILNGVGYIENYDTTCYSGENLLSFIYRLPVLGEELMSAYSCSRFPEYLSTYADPEFNLISWPFYIMSDMGTPITILISIILGRLMAWMYKNTHKSLLCLIFYPFLYLGLLDFLRQGYLHGARTFYIYVGLFVSYYVLKNHVTFRRTSFYINDVKVS